MAVYVSCDFCGVMEQLHTDATPMPVSTVSGYSLNMVIVVQMHVSTFNIHYML